MITSYPTMLDGEIDYSIFARIWDIRQYRSKNVFMKELFGNEVAVASTGLANHISYFIDNLAPGHGYTFDSFVDKHTLLSWITSFQSHKRALDLRSDVRSQKKYSIGVLAGMARNCMPLASGLRLCPNCVDIDRGKHGFCYWHREHQMFGIDVCYMHGIPLQTFEKLVRNQSDRRLYLSAENALRMMELENNVSPVCFEDTRWKLARDAHWILCQHDLPSRLTSVHDRYRLILESLGLLTSKGLTRMQSIADLFQKSHPHELITSLRCKIVKPLDSGWLARILSDKGIQHPIRHLILLYALGESAETFFDQNRVYKPFGLGPWPCLNPVCPQYEQYVIHNCYITKNTRSQSIGVFTCELCKFSYVLNQGHGNDNTGKYDLVKKYGSLWEEKLRETWNDATMSVGRIARYLGVSVTAILSSAIRLDLTFPKPGSNFNKPKRLERKPKIDIHRDEYRRLWLEVQNKSPDAPRTKIKEHLPRSVYIWLLKNDATWLDGNSPRRSMKPGKSQFKSNSIEQDSDLARLALESALQIKNHPGFPIRITIAEIARRVDKLWVLQRRLDKFPETQAVIQEVIESLEEYTIRKMKYIALQAKRSNITLTRYYLLRKSGTKRLRGNEFVEQAIQNILEEYNSIQPGLSIE